MAQVPVPIRILVMIASPKDGPAFDPDREWQALKAGLDPLVSAGQVQLVRLEEPTENALKRRLAAEPWHALHFIGRGRSQGARYATLIFEGQAKTARAVTARHLGELLRPHDSVRLAVLQSCVGEKASFCEAAALLEEDGLPIIVTAAPESTEAATQFARAFYSSLAAGESAEQAVARAREKARAVISLHGSGSAGATCGPESTPTPAPAAPVIAPAPAPSVASLEAAAAVARRDDLERRRKAGAFDVFLCHNVKDKPAVKAVGRQLMDRGILPWLDEWELRPGMPWQRLLEEQIAGINAAVVFVGPDGVGPWQRNELDSFLRQFVTRSCPVIPVLLPLAPREPQLPIFLQAMTWVDLRGEAKDSLDRLIWGITGRQAPIGS